MRIYSLYDGGYGSMCYLVSDDGNENAVLIDPSVSYARAIASVGGTMPKISAILLTHGHFDHILFLDEWREKTGAPVCISREDASMLGNPELSCYRMFFGEDKVHADAERILEEGEEISFGKEKLRVYKVPGHTAGSLIFEGDGVLFTGDTVFAYGGYGRYDLPSGSAQHLARSLHRIFTEFPPSYRIYPGHGSPSTLKDERPLHHV